MASRSPDQKQSDPYEPPKIREVQNPAEPVSETRHGHRGWYIGIGAVIILLLLLLLLRHRAASKAQEQKAAASAGRNRAVPVSAATVEQRDVPVYLDGLGNVNALNTVTVKTRIDGQLVRFNFNEGQEVRAGAELALIDPRPSEAQLAQAQATRNRDAATLHNAELDLKRFADLYKGGVISEQQYNTQQSLVRMNQGTIQSDEAQIQQASLNVSYCHIKAPISGRVGIRFIDPGNMVHASDANGLLVIAQMHPIAILFTLPEDSVAAIAPHLQRGELLPVEAWSRDSSQLIGRGRLLTIDNQIDPNTGTFRCKAEFDNADGALFPNQFVNARLLVDVRHKALTIPSAAVQHGAQGTYVYVVGPDSTADVQQVSVAMTEGTTAVIGSGLNPGDRVITDGADKVQPHGKVEIDGGKRGGAGGGGGGAARGGGGAAGGAGGAARGAGGAAGGGGGGRSGQRRGQSQ